MDVMDACWGSACRYGWAGRRLYGGEVAEDEGERGWDRTTVIGCKEVEELEVCPKNDQDEDGRPQYCDSPLIPAPHSQFESTDFPRMDSAHQGGRPQRAPSYLRSFPVQSMFRGS